MSTYSLNEKDIEFLSDLVRSYDKCSLGYVPGDSCDSCDSCDCANTLFGFVSQLVEDFDLSKEEYLDLSRKIREKSSNLSKD